ncbi:acid ceramidase-like [Diadema antillarum]|uniref:acid ceramidase-like n=1 Tax=Diadema antillarum TaxID=105358 RepID=UPI003A85B694
MQAVLLLIVFLVVAAPAVQGQDLPPFTDKYCHTDAYPPPANDTLPAFVLNLDLKPEDRWTGLVKPKANEISFLIQDIKALIGLFINETIGTEIIDGLFAAVVETLPEPYSQEIKGIAYATNIPVGEIVLFNIFYEVSSFCTAIVAQDKNGDIYHARNMDFGIFLGWDTKTDTWIVTERLKPLLTNVEYQQGGKTVARGVHFAGYIGLLTGLKPGVVSLNINSRHKFEQSGFLGFIKWVLGQRTAHFTGFALRDAVLMATDFNSTVNHLSTVELLLPSYLIIGGTNPGEGAVVTRAQGTTSDDIKRLDPSKGEWFLVQTNYDNWKSTPFYDDRRDPAMKCMQNTTQANVGFNGIFNVLSTKPVLNVLSTFTALMHVKNGTLNAHLRYCPEPCYPW